MVPTMMQYGVGMCRMGDPIRRRQPRGVMIHGSYLIVQSMQARLHSGPWINRPHCILQAYHRIIEWLQ